MLFLLRAGGFSALPHKSNKSNKNQVPALAEVDHHHGSHHCKNMFPPECHYCWAGALLARYKRWGEKRPKLSFPKRVLYLHVLSLLLTSTWAVALASEIYGAGTSTAATLMAELTNGYEFYTDNVCKCSSRKGACGEITTQRTTNLIG